MTQQDRDERILTLYREGSTCTAIAKALSCSWETARKVVDRAADEGLVERRTKTALNTERDKAVLDLRRLGKTYGQIAKALGLTRSAVAGIVGRSKGGGLQFKSRPGPQAKPRRPLPPLPKRSKPQFATPKPPPAPRPQVITTPPAARPDIEPPGSVSLRDAGPEQCRWPLWERDLPKVPHVCGARTVEGLSWCPEHLARVTAKAAEREAA